MFKLFSSRLENALFTNTYMFMSLHETKVVINSASAPTVLQRSLSYVKMRVMKLYDDELDIKLKI